VKLSGIDANLLAALDALLREKSVTRAARRLGVGQPALSHSLSRLRDHFKDELLVLRGRNYVLTDKAEKLASVVANATRALAEVFEEQPSFDAATSSYRFVVACSDLFGILIIPELLRTLGAARHVEVSCVPSLPRRKSVLEGRRPRARHLRDVPQHQPAVPLRRSGCLCRVRANHEQVGKRLTLETYGKLPHLEIGPPASSIPALHIDDRSPPPSAAQASRCACRICSRRISWSADHARACASGRMQRWRAFGSSIRPSSWEHSQMAEQQRRPGARGSGSGLPASASVADWLTGT
jgi:DNA-binding transcriptional LysR family regulator